jgi:hypothetical protein
VFVATFVVAFACASSVLAGEAQAPLLRTPQYVDYFAADGTRAVFAWDEYPRCERAAVWDAATGGWSAEPTPQYPICPDDWAGIESQDVAIAGGRIAWLAHGATNGTSELDIYTARIGQRTAGRLVDSGVGADFQGDDSDELGWLRGDDSTIVYVKWTSYPRNTLRGETVWRINAAGQKREVGAFPALVGLTVHDGTIATLQRSGLLTLIPASGAGGRMRLHLRGIHLVDRLDFYLALTGTQVVVLTGGAVAVFDRSTGAREAVWPVSGKVKNRGDLDVENGVALYMDDNRIKLIRLADGARATVAPWAYAPKACNGGLVWAQLEQAGLFFSVSRDTFSHKPGCEDPSWIGLIPWEQVLTNFPR